MFGQIQYSTPTACFHTHLSLIEVEANSACAAEQLNRSRLSGDNSFEFSLSPSPLKPRYMLAAGTNPVSPRVGTELLRMVFGGVVSVRMKERESMERCEN